MIDYDLTVTMSETVVFIVYLWFPPQVTNNQVVYVNSLKYDVPKIQGPIRRTVSFTMSVACYFNR